MESNNRRYWVYMKSGRKFCVEEYGDPHTTWGNVIPGQSKIEKVGSKVDEVIGPHNTLITKENGFKSIVMLDPGTSPLGYIEALDASGLDRFEEITFGKYED